MKNRDRFVGLRPQDAKVYPSRVLMENGQPVERVISANKAAATSRENRKQAKEIDGTRRHKRKSGLLRPNN
jgi:hypothetical protein